MFAVVYVLGMSSIHVNSRNSTWNNSGFSVITMCSLARDPCNIADLSSRGCLYKIIINFA